LLSFGAEGFCAKCSLTLKIKQFKNIVNILAILHLTEVFLKSKTAAELNGKTI